MEHRFRLGVDIGGTFTDAVLLDEVGGSIIVAKVPSTPPFYEQGFFQSVRNVAGDFDWWKVRFISHGTTIATNALLQHQHSRIALITTKGFRDVLEIGTQLRPSLYDLTQKKPPPLVPRDLRIELNERINAEGKVVTPIQEEELHRVAKSLISKKVDAVAVCLLFSYINPAHEKKVREYLKKTLGNEFPVIISSEACPEYREFWRMSTTAVDAYLYPIVARYLKTIHTSLNQLSKDRGITLYIMQSNGGLASPEFAITHGANMVESGPAAGAMAAKFISESSGLKRVISLDVGGTTAKSTIIDDGKVSMIDQYEVGGKMHGRVTGRGYPVKITSVDIAEVGAGGGSIARVDSGKFLSVGPESAGADPGPACYEKGGAMPTLTDAYVVLGYLDPNYFLGGSLKLNPRLAEDTIRKHIAEPLGLSILEAAASIVKVANNNTAEAIRVVSIQRGLDPRDFTLFAFGGAGPLISIGVAKELGIARIMIPAFPGLTSALGLTLTDLRHDYRQPFHRLASNVGIKEIRETFAQLVEKANEQFVREGFDVGTLIYGYSADMRYVGQAFELSTPIPHSYLTAKDGVNRIENSFRKLHMAIYGHHGNAGPIEFVQLKLTVQGRLNPVNLKSLAPRRVNGGGTPKGERSSYIDGRLIRVPVYDRATLLPNQEIRGPAIIEAGDSTCVVDEGDTAFPDEYGNINIEIV